jgi:hypothetical protein
LAFLLQFQVDKSTASSLLVSNFEPSLQAVEVVDDTDIIGLNSVFKVCVVDNSPVGAGIEDVVPLPQGFREGNLPLGPLADNLFNQYFDLCMFFLPQNVIPSFFAVSVDLKKSAISRFKSGHKIIKNKEQATSFFFK